MNPITARRILWAGLALYVAGFSLTLPKAFSVKDEVFYTLGARTLSEGSTRVALTNPLSGETRWVLPSTYPAGTSLIEVPFVFLFGWQSAPWASVFALIFATLLTAALLVARGQSPAFALIVLGFPPTLVMGRLAMSDVPSAAVVALGLWLFWKGEGRAPKWWLASGFVAGASLLFRETDILLFAPLFAGTLFRRERGRLALIAGGLAGCALRPILMGLLTGDPFLFHPNSYRWSLGAFARNAPLYGMALLIMVPAGIVLAVLHRGKRRPETIFTVVAYSVLFCGYEYAGKESGGLKGLVLGARFLIPLLPWLAICAADTLPRLASEWSERTRTIGAAAARVWIAGIFIAILAVHLVVGRWSDAQHRLVRIIYANTTESRPIITGLAATERLINPLYGPRNVIDRIDLASWQVPEFLGQRGYAHLILLDRTGSDFWNRVTEENERYVEEVSRLCRLELLDNAEEKSIGRLRIWKIRNCDAPAQTSPPAASRD